MTALPVPPDLYALFLATVVVVMMTPGPSTMLGVAHGMSFGWRRTVFTALGDISANFLQMLAAVAGLGVILSQSVTAFMVIKVLGVLYLVYLGIKLLRSRDAAFAGTARAAGQRHSRGWHFRRGFVVAGTSPKAILFYTALFPQFISPDAALWPQFALLAASCMAIDLCVVVFYGYLAQRGAAAMTGGGAGRWINKVSGGLMLLAAALLARTQPAA